MRGVEVADSAVVGEEVTATEQLRGEVDIALVLEKAIVFELHKWSEK